MSDAELTLPVLDLLRQEKHGLLSTLSRKLDGWPFGSLTPYALSRSNEPILLLSDLAEHTHNLRADARVSLFAQDSAARDNPQAGARVTLVGLAEEVAEDEIAEARDSYLARFPESAAILQLGGFHLFRLKVARARYIGGFGKMYWLDGSDLIVQGG